MKVEIVGKFYDNHSLSIINRNLAILLKDKCEVLITPFDAISPEYGVPKETLKILKSLMQHDSIPDIQIRHTYPPIWSWPTDSKTKVMYIQPWEFNKLPFEWQYKFETFADAVCVPSNYERDIILQGGIDPDKIFAVPNGYDPDIFNKKKVEPYPGIDPDKFNFVFVGNGQWRKGVDILLNNWKDSFSKYDNCRLIIKDNPAVYGINNLLNEIIKMQYKTDCAEILYIDEQLTDLEMASIYKNAKILVHPYRAEGFGMHIQEAYACGCLPVLPDFGPHQDFIPDDHYLKVGTEQQAFNVCDPTIFATKPGDATTLMSTHSFYREPIGHSLQGAIKYIYHHHHRDEWFEKIEAATPENTWSFVADKYMEVLENVAGRKGTQRS